jgi:hypothetical protein
MVVGIKAVNVPAVRSKLAMLKIFVNVAIAHLQDAQFLNSSYPVCPPAQWVVLSNERTCRDRGHFLGIDTETPQPI